MLPKSKRGRWISLMVVINVLHTHQIVVLQFRLTFKCFIFNTQLLNNTDVQNGLTVTTGNQHQSFFLVVPVVRMKRSRLTPSGLLLHLRILVTWARSNSGVSNPKVQGLFPSAVPLRSLLVSCPFFLSISPKPVWTHHLKKKTERKKNKTHFSSRSDSLGSKMAPLFCSPACLVTIS